MSYFEMRKKYFSGGLDPDLVLDIDALNYISGTNTPDASSYNNNGTAINVTCSTALYNFRNSTVNKIDVPISDSLIIRRNITLEALFRPAYVQNGGVIGRWGSNNARSKYILSIESTIIMAVSMGFFGYIIISGGTYSPENWLHVVGVGDRDLETLTLYVNGIQVNTISGYSHDIGSYTTDETTRMNIGTLRDEDYVYNLNGDVMIGRIYKKALTQAEVTARFEEIRGRVGL